MDNENYFADKKIEGFNPLLADNKTLFDMSLKFANGDGIEADYIAAHICLNIAALRGCKESAAYRKELSLDMDAQEISMAQRKARALMEMMKKNYEN